MIQQIISHTPVYVWALLAFLIYRGWLASQDRDTSLLKVALIPLVMLGLAVSGLHGDGPLGQGVWAVWAVGAAASAAALWTLATGAIAVDRAAGTLRQRGSWMPLCLMMAIFATKYAVAVLSALHPEVAHSLPFAASVTLLYGVFNGLFLGRLARYAAAWLRQPLPLAAL
ncbi:hypothetical protein FHW58_001897 [Duganella sp. 1224]|uniref:DUF6622 family protein n=1 Tax=Duganella sp. 1224 TaxID=2587052 RepID=UPI0015C83100|nr:DUF6622 family protein [Duganella sp. 1224]NYE60745.1 hypothetical protein [Duganella sp. 1224]